MRISNISQSFYPYIGGLARYVRALGKNFKMNGHNFEIVSFKSPITKRTEILNGIKIHRIDAATEQEFDNYLKFKELILDVTHRTHPQPRKVYERLFEHGFAGYLKINGVVYKYIKGAYRRKSFDILNVHDFQVLPQAFLLEGELEVPKVFTWHIPFTEYIPHRWRVFFIKFMKFYDRVVFSTPEYVRTAVESGLPEEKAVMIYPFIDTCEFVLHEENNLREKLHIAQDMIVILCVSRIDPRKGQEVLIKAMKNVVKKFKKVVCIFVGNGSFSKESIKGRGERKNRLLELVDRLKLNKRCIFVGKKRGKRLLKFYDIADIVVQPSIAEGFGLTMSEAMCFKKPVVGSNLGGLPEQIKHGYNGFIFRSKDYKDLSDKLIKLIEDENLRKKMGKRGFKIVNKKFCAERGYRDYLKLYRALV